MKKFAEVAQQSAAENPLGSNSAGGGAIPTPPLHFSKIAQRKATELIIRYHYLHHRCQIEWCWGILNEKNEVLGVLTIGRPAAWSAMASVVGETHKDYDCPLSRSHDVYELNRLWLADELPKNTESRFIAWCLRELRREKPEAILISYAEGSVGHVGYVYQATNWLYLGQSAEFTDIIADGWSDYRSVPQEVRGGAVYKCQQHGFFEGMLPTNKKTKKKNKDLPEAPKDFPCPDCGAPSDRQRSRAWCFVRENSSPKLLQRGKKRVWKHYVLAHEKLYTMRLKERSAKHQYVWFASSKDVMLLPRKFWQEKDRAGFPYPKSEANHQDEQISTGRSQESTPR